MCEFFGEGLSPAQFHEYLAYAERLRSIEHSDFVARELQHHLIGVTEYGAWLCEEVEGSDMLGEMLAHSRRCVKLCEREIERRKRLNRYPPSAGLVFRDWRAERQAIIERTVEIIGTYTALTKRGKEWKGRCIFHDDKSPSLSVNAEKGLWFCFACATGGNIFDFIERAGGKIGNGF